MRPGLASLAVFSSLALVVYGCGSDRIDPPKDEDLLVEETAPEVDSLAAWSSRARAAWARGDSASVREAAALARAAFAGAWLDRLDEVATSENVRSAERLPSSRESALPAPESIASALAAMGLDAEVTVASGPFALWQVVVRDPTGAADAGAEFWVWPDPAAPSSEPVLQPLPATAPRRARYGPEALGAITTFTKPKGVGLVSVWTRPRGGAGVEVAIAERATTGGRAADWKVVSNRMLPIAADSLAFEADAAGALAPVLVVRGPGARDPLFESCPTCPAVQKLQRWAPAGTGATWTLREEHAEATPYAAIVAFMHGLRDGGPEGALPWARGPEVLDQVRELGLERGPHAPLRAAPGTDPNDMTQRFRRGSSGGADALEISVERAGERWVVADLRPTRIVIE